MCQCLRDKNGEEFVKEPDTVLDVDVKVMYRTNQRFKKKMILLFDLSKQTHTTV